MNDDDLKDFIKIESGLQRKMVLKAIAGLKVPDQKVKLSFWEHRSLKNRKNID